VTDPADAMDAEALIAIGRALAKPVVRLVAEPQGEPIGVWHAGSEDGPPERLYVDISAHPDAGCRRPGVLELRYDASEEAGEARLVRRLVLGETRLYGVPAIDPPCADILFARGGAAVHAWLRANEWQPEWGINSNFRRADVVAEYESFFFRETAWGAPEVYAQLGGWPMGWPDAGATEQLRDPIALRTYRGSEPWIECFWRRPEYEVVVRGT
jgi:hypothetical protein